MIDNLFVGEMELDLVENKGIKEIDYLGWVLRKRSLRDLDSICEYVNERIPLSEVIEENVILWNVSLSDHQPSFLRGAIEYFPLLKGTSRK